MVEVFNRYRLPELIIKQFEEIMDDLSPKERLKFLLEMAALAIQASPRTLDIEGSPTITLLINGIAQTRRIDQPTTEIVQGEEPPNPRALTAPPVDWSAGLPGGKAGRCEAIRSLDKPPEPPPPPVQPVFREATFTVPTVEDELGPVEWRDPLYPESEQ